MNRAHKSYNLLYFNFTKVKPSNNFPLEHGLWTFNGNLQQAKALLMGLINVAGLLGDILMHNALEVVMF